MAAAALQFLEVTSFDNILSNLFAHSWPIEANLLIPARPVPIFTSEELSFIGKTTVPPNR